MTFGLYILIVLTLVFIYLGFHFVHQAKHMEAGHDSTLALGCFAYTMATILLIASAMLYRWGTR